MDNKKTKRKLIDTNNSMVVTRGKGAGGVITVKGGQIQGLVEVRPASVWLVGY